MASEASSTLEIVMGSDVSWNPSQEMGFFVIFKINFKDFFYNFYIWPNISASISLNLFIDGADIDSENLI